MTAIQAWTPLPFKYDLTLPQKYVAKLMILQMIDLHVLQEAKPLGAAPGKPIQGPALWYAKDYQEKPELWAYCLTPADIDELNAAVAKIASSQKDLKVPPAQTHDS